MKNNLKKIMNMRCQTVFFGDDLSFTEKIEFILLLGFGLILTGAFGFWWFDTNHIPNNFDSFLHAVDVVLFIILSYIVWHHIIMELFAWYITMYAKKPEEIIAPQEGLRVAYATAFVPGSEPYDILEATLKAMVEVDYPHDTWLLDEGDDEKARELCEKYGVFHHTRKGKEEFNTHEGKFRRKTKGGNYNSWLHMYHDRYDILAQHDVDFIPRKDYLTRTLGYFSDPEVAFVGSPQIYGNVNESWIARGAAEQTYGFYGPLQRGFYGNDMTLLIGANHIMRINAYIAIDGYTAHIAEDMLTGMKLYTDSSKWKSVYVPEALLIGEGPSTWDAYLIQQMRWAYGCMDINLRHAPKMFKKMNMRKVFNYSLLQQFYFGGVAQTAGVVLLTLYFFFGISSATMTFLPILMLYIPLIIYQTLFQLWLQRFHISPEKEKGLLLRGKFLALAAWPIYFIAFIGVLRKKSLTYKVTPKGTSQEVQYLPTLFIPHFVLGTITLVGIVWGTYHGNDAMAIIFWATLNTFFMYIFFFFEATPHALNLVQEKAKPVHQWLYKKLNKEINQSL